MSCCSLVSIFRIIDIDIGKVPIPTNSLTNRKKNYSHGLSVPRIYARILEEAPSTKKGVGFGCIPFILLNWKSRFYNRAYFARSSNSLGGLMIITGLQVLGGLSDWLGVQDAYLWMPVVCYTACEKIKKKHPPPGHRSVWPTLITIRGSKVDLSWAIIRRWGGKIRAG